MQLDINKLKICMNSMKKDIEFIKISLEENKTEHKEILDEIKDWIQSSESRFAGRWTEKVLIWTGIAMGGTMIAAFMNLILK